MSRAPWRVAAAVTLAFVGGGLLMAYGLTLSVAAVGVLWWPQLGLLSALTVLTRGTGARCLVAAAGGVGSGLTATYMFGSSAGVMVITGILFVHAMLTSTVIDRALRGRPVDSPSQAARYLAALAVGAGVNALVSTAWAVSQGGDLATALSRYVIPMLIGDLALATPIVFWRTRHQVPGDAKPFELCGHLVAVVASTAFVFWSFDNRDFGYLSLLTLLIVALRCGPFWVAVCAAASTLVATSLLATSDVTTGNELVPTFLLVTNVAGLLMVAAVAQRRGAQVELKHARDIAEGSAREFEAFSYAVAHDLRSPLRAIDGFGNVLAQEHSDRLDAEGRALLERVRSSARHMGALIDSLLTLAKVSYTEVSVGPVDLTTLAQQSLDRLRSSDPRPAMDVAIARGALAHVDLPLMGIVLDNLLENAWKFTRDCERPRIEFGWQPAPDATTFWVTDNGIGFDMAYREKLFQPFQRLHSVAEAAGTGIGLATTARIIERHGGSIEAFGVVGQGATFTVKLPKQPTRSTESRIPAQQSQNGRTR